MQQQTSALVTLGGLVCVSVVLAMTSEHVVELDSRIALLITKEQQEQEVQTLTEKVQVGERVITVTTTRGDNETVEAFVARHNAAVAAVQGGG